MATIQMKAQAKLDRSRQVAPQVFEQVQDKILSLDLPPGTVLSRTALQAEFGLSQTPIRDALIRLAEEGLVEVFPQYATVVSRIDLSLARQAHFLRLAIELEAMRRVTLAGDTALHRDLEQILDEQAVNLTPDRTQRFSELDRAFHRLFYTAAGVPDLWALVRKQSGHIDRLRRLHLPLPGKTRSIIADHRAILAAVIARDPAAVEQALRAHLSGTLGTIEEITARHPDFIKT